MRHLADIKGTFVNKSSRLLMMNSVPTLTPLPQWPHLADIKGTVVKQVLTAADEDLCSHSVVSRLAALVAPPSRYKGNCC